MNSPTGRVLVIEDNPLNLELVAAVLESLGCEIVPAASAELGLELAIQSPPDVILLDMWLPGMSGEDAIRFIRQHESLARIPVIAITAQAMRGDEASALRLGFDAWVSKPIDNRRLRELVRGYLHVRHESG
jgi:two-component system cell cycle response regulator DivK